MRGVPGGKHLVRIGSFVSLRLYSPLLEALANLNCCCPHSVISGACLPKVLPPYPRRPFQTPVKSWGSCGGPGTGGAGPRICRGALPPCCGGFGGASS